MIRRRKWGRAHPDPRPAPNPMDEIQNQLVDALLLQVTARLAALPPGWAVAVKMDAPERSVGRMSAHWTIRALGPREPHPHGWAIFVPAAEPCDTERRARAG